MPNARIPPDRESELVPFLVNLNTKIQLAPATYNVPAAVATDLNTKVTDFVDQWNLIQDPSQTTRPAIGQKNVLKRACLDVVRPVIGIIQSTPTVTDEQRLDLGLIPRDVQPSPIPAPAMAPEISIRGVSGWTVNMQLTNPGSESPNAKPQGVAGATIFMFVGDNAPSNQDAWEFFANVTRTKLTLNFPSTLTPGTKLWLTAFWRNPTDASGPFAVPVSTQINYGGLAVAS